MIYHLEGSLASSDHTGGLHYADVFPLPPARDVVPVAWIQDMEVTSSMYVFALDKSQLRGRHRLRPGSLATVIRQVLAPSGLGLAPTANSPGSGSQTSLFLLLLRQCGCPYSLDDMKPPCAKFIAQLTAVAGDYAYIILRIWAGQTSPWRPADVLIANEGFLALLVHIDPSSSFCLGDTGAFGPGF
jgi:hypothetical protein